MGPGDRLHRHESVLIAYDNLGPNPYSYLLVVAVDERGEVFWYYPALGTDGEESVSIPAHAGSAVELTDEIRHELEPGPLRLFAVFTRSPMSVYDVEVMLHKPNAATALARLPILDSAQDSIGVMVDAD